MDPFKLLFSAFKRLTTAITSPFRMFIVRFQRLFNINIITAKLITPITKKVKSLLRLKPQEQADYVKVGRFLIFKKLFLTVVLIACASVFLYYMMFAPKLPAKAPAAEAVKTSTTFAYDDMEISTFSGIANIQSEDGATVYTGEVDKGVCKGNGVLYNRDGKLLYEGAFEQNMYQGKGMQYYPEGGLHYDGEFLENRYNGAGKLYDRKGNLIFDGSFKDGLYDGEGKLYDQAGTLQYDGSFSRGLYHGTGVRYYADGGLDYEGEFFQGRPEGMGTLYSRAGKPIYQGSMHNGEINYRSLVNATLEDVEEAFLETPRVYYGDKDSCFVFEEAGVIVSTDCRVQVDVWEKPKTKEEEASQYYYMPDDIPATSVSNHPRMTAPTTRVLHAKGDVIHTVLAENFYLYSPLKFVYISGNPDASESQTVNPPAQPQSQPQPETDSVDSAPSNPNSRPVAESQMNSTVDSKPQQIPQEEFHRPDGQLPPNQPNGNTQMVLPESEKKPDFVEKNLVLYFEIDKNVWQSEAELDKSKVIVNRVTVMNPQGFVTPKEKPYDENLPPNLEDCVAIDYARREQPTVFSNILFEMDKQNKLFVRLKNISYAERIVQKSYQLDGLIYRCCYPLDESDQLMYYSIEQ